MVVVAPDHPMRLLPANDMNATERLLVDLLYDPLYRLDEAMQPVPELARDLPEVSRDGLTWRIPVRADARFHDGSRVTPEDVVFSLRLAASPSCPLGRELCAAVAGPLAGDPERDGNGVLVRLREPHAPFLADALGRLPILSEGAVRSATAELVAAAGRLQEDRPDVIVDDITAQVLDEACLADDPPAGCLLSEHRDRLEQVFRRARLTLPPRVPFTDESGAFDEDAYVDELLDRLAALGRVLTTADADKRSAALALLDPTTTPLGGGPYRLTEIRDDGTYVLAANRDHTRSAPDIPRIELRVERDPSVAVTRLLSGDADWVLEVGAEQVEAVTDVPGVRAATRPLDLQYGILFNVRPERVYFDAVARRAFALCLDHAALATRLDADRAIATTPYTATSWARPPLAPRARDVEAARALLERAGWVAGADGVRERDGVRLSTSIAVRPSSVDLFSFANQAAEQLSECGIELRVEELDLTGDTMLEQLLWPNDFDTLLLGRVLGPDPDGAVRSFESSRITTESNQADANPSGFTSALADHLISSARGTLDETARGEAYADIARLLAEDVPYWPLWYDSAVSAISERVHGPDGPIDPSAARFDWDISSWTLGAAAG
jgi:ABC-type transport system substrate-binding protein